MPALVWVPARPDLDGNVERSETCEAGEHRLLVVQMRDSYLSSQPQAMPRVSWSVYRGLEIIVGGSAPTLDDARARVELMWRTLAGLKGS